MIWLKLLILVTIAALWRLGGKYRGRIRDIPIPLIIALYGAIVYAWWLFPMLWATYQIIRLGYGNYDPEYDSEPSLLARITHDRDGWWLRGIYGLLVGAVGALPLMIYTKQIHSYGAYILINSFVNFFVSRLGLKDLPAELLVGTGVGSIVFLI